MRPFHLLGAALAAFVPFGGPAEAGERQRATIVVAEDEGSRKNQQDWGYSSAIIAGDTIYLSGVVVGLRPGESDAAAAFDRVYQLIGRTLERSGASWDDVVDMTSFHTNVEEQIGAMVAAQKKHVKAPFPAWTAIGVSKILGGGIAEIKITARRPTRGAGQ